MFRGRWRIITAIAIVAGVAWASPRPGTRPTAWQLDIDFHDPQPITVRLPGDEADTTYWYVLYTVTNNSGQDIPFYPTFVIVTDRLDTIEGGDGISPTVVDAVKARHRQVYQFFMYPAEVYGTLRQGEDNALTSAVVFQPPDPAVNQFTLLIGGLSGEIVRIKNRAFDVAAGESPDNARFLMLRKTLAADYHIPGDLETRGTAEPMRVDLKWVMR